MGQRDTSIGRGRDRFPSTRWSRLVESPRGSGESGGDAAGDAPLREADGTELAARYWRPVYAYVRRRWSRNNEDAKDLTQSFFVWMLEHDFVQQADPARGRFRAFLRTALERFLTDDQRGRKRRKRGGDRVHVELPGADDADLLAMLQDDKAVGPVEALDEEWRRTVLAQALELLRDEMKASGKATSFAVFEDYFLDDSDTLDYARVAERHGISKVDVSNALARTKRAYRAWIRRVVADTVKGADELEEELAWLYGGSSTRREEGA